MKRFCLFSCAVVLFVGCSSGDTPEAPQADSTAQAGASKPGGNNVNASGKPNNSANNSGKNAPGANNNALAGGSTSNPSGSSPWAGNSGASANTSADSTANSAKTGISPEEQAFSQNIAHLAASAQEHIRRGYIDAAVTARTEIVEQVAAFYGKDSWQTQNAQLALDHTKRVINLTPEQKLTYDAINEHDVAGQQQTRLGNADAAIGQFRLATTLATQLWGPDSHVVGNLKHKEALVHQAKGSYAAAESLFLQAMDIRRRALGETHPDYSTSINALGVLYHRWGQHEKAEKALKDAIANVKQVWGADHAEYATAINNLGMLYSSMKRFDEAITELTKVAELRRGPTDEPNALYGHALFNLGSVYYQAERYDEALPKLEEALAMLEPTIGRQHDITVMLLNNLAMSYMAKTRYDEAEKLLVEVAAVMERRYGKQTIEFAQATHNVGVLYLNQKLYAKAEPYVDQAVEIRMQLGGAEATGLSFLYKDKATIMRNTGRVAEADSLEARAEALAARQANSVRQ